MGEAWRRTRAKSYVQQEDRALAAMYRPTLERLWRGFKHGQRLVCVATVDRSEVVVGSHALLIMTLTAGVVARGAEKLGHLDEASLAYLRTELTLQRPGSIPMTELVVTIDSVGAFEDEFVVVLSEEESDDAN